MDINEIKSALDEHGKALDAKMQEYHAELEKHGNASTNITAKIDELSDSYKSLRDELTDVARKQTAAAASDTHAESLGAQFVESDAFSALAKRQVNSARIEVKNTVVGDGTTTFPMQRPDIVGGSFLPLTIRQALTAVNVESSSVTAIREATHTNSAAETAQGAAKPESVVTFEQFNVPMETVAHFIKVSNQLLADAPAVTSYIDTRLRDGLAQRIDAQLLVGNGTAPNLSGLTDAGNFVAFTATSGANLADSINKAKYERWAAGEVPDSVIVNPADWGALEVLREGAGSGMYLYGAPGTIAGLNPFGLQVIISNHMPAGSFLVGNLRGSVILYQRQSAVIEMGFVNDDFTKNLVTIRAEERLGLGVDRPAGLTFGAITAV